MWKNNKGAALMQVLLISIILAGMAVMLMRAGLSRISSARRTRRSVTAEMLVESCMAEITANWIMKTPEAFERDMTGLDNNGNPYMYKDSNSENQDEQVCDYGDLGKVSVRWWQDPADKQWRMEYRVEL